MANTDQKQNVQTGKSIQKPTPFFQAKLMVNAPGDKYEQEADAIADRVVATEGKSAHEIGGAGLCISPIQRKCAECEEEEEVQMKGFSKGGEAGKDVEIAIRTESGGGEALGKETRIWMESRFGTGFGNVRIHDNHQSHRVNRKLNAKAFTHQNNIFFNSGQYKPESTSGKKLLAHELTHVVQQKGHQQSLQRTVELRPPGRGEASAFERREELIDRLNRVSTGVTYTLNERVLEYRLIEGATLSFFDQRMIGFIDSASLLPMRLITGRGLVGSSAHGFSTLLIDSFMTGYVDLEDLLASDDTSFQMNLLHILTERSMARNYARRIGSPGLSPIDASGNETPEFRRAHRAGNDAEAAFLQSTFNDPTIRFASESSRGQTITFTFRSAEKYRIIHTFRRLDRTVTGGQVAVINAAGETVSVEDFIRQRAAVAVP